MKYSLWSTHRKIFNSFERYDIVYFESMLVFVSTPILFLGFFISM